MLRSGQVEEFILNILEFDLMFLTPSDFIYFFMKAWNYLQCGDDQINKWDKNKIEMLAIEISTNLQVKLIGQVHYLPSQIALNSLIFARNTILQKS